MSKNTKKNTKKLAAVASVTPPVPVVKAISVKTESEKIWDEIKNLPIQMFGLPSQTVAQYCTPVAVDPNRLFLTIRSSATLPSLEISVAGKFNVELADKFVIVTRLVKPLV